MFDIILFDLDGTLTDSGKGITNSVAYALTKFGLKYESKESLRCFIGPPLIRSFVSNFGVTEEEGRRLVELYREYYSVEGIFENDVYDGIPALLEDLTKNGKKLVLATSKPEHYAEKILTHFDLAKYFSVVAGATMDEKRTEKDDVIRYAIEKAEIGDVSKAVMIGDREYDVLGAKKFQIASIGVLYGYGSREELMLAGADHIAEKVQDIAKFI